MDIHEQFHDGLHPAWDVTETGSARVRVNDGTLHLHRPAADDGAYHNAQITDYGRNLNFTLRPPLRLSVTARASHSGDGLRGTAGFGLWNHAFAPDTRRMDLPQALWFFFASPPSNMALAYGQPGHGWKAAKFNAKRAAFLALLPTAPLAIPLMHIPPLYDALWPVGQRALGVQETALDDNMLSETHTYTLDWQHDQAKFAVDGETVLIARDGLPDKPLGFVAWLDNQYAVVTPRGQFRFGLVAADDDQTLMIDAIELSTG